MTTIHEMVETYIKRSAPYEVIEFGDGFKYWRSWSGIHRLKVDELKENDYETVYICDKGSSYKDTDEILVHKMVSFYRATYRDTYI